MTTENKKVETKTEEVKLDTTTEVVENVEKSIAIEEALGTAKFEKYKKTRKVIAAGEDFSPTAWNPFAARPSRFQKEQKDNFESRLLQVKRVIKVTKGGRRFKFFALVVVGDRNGRVGFASAKDIEVPNAIAAAERLAKKNLFRVKMVGKNKTIPHDIRVKFGSADVLLKPAGQGKGIIASNNIRAVVELAGYENIYSKSMGSTNPKNVVYATIKALMALRTKEEVEKIRDKQISISKKVNKK